jgi:hypothetical protein
MPLTRKNHSIGWTVFAAANSASVHTDLNERIVCITSKNDCKALHIGNESLQPSVLNCHAEHQACRALHNEHNSLQPVPTKRAELYDFKAIHILRDDWRCAELHHEGGHWHLRADGNSLQNGVLICHPATSHHERLQALTPTREKNSPYPNFLDQAHDPR